MAVSYKIIMLGATIYVPYQILGDNDIIVTNLSIPSSTLKNNHNSIIYLRVRENLAVGVLKLECIPGKSNPYDLLTNILGLLKEFLV